MNAKVTIQEAEHLLQEIISEEDDRFQILMKDERKGYKSSFRSGINKRVSTKGKRKISRNV